MPLTIPDEVLEQAKLSEAEARVEIACRLYDAGKLDLWPAAQFAGLDRVDFEAELVRRELPVFRPTWEEIEHDLRAVGMLNSTKHEAPFGFYR